MERKEHEKAIAMERKESEQAAAMERKEDEQAEYTSVLRKIVRKTAKKVAVRKAKKKVVKKIVKKKQPKKKTWRGRSNLVFGESSTTWSPTDSLAVTSALARGHVIFTQSKCRDYCNAFGSYFPGSGCTTKMGEDCAAPVTSNLRN